MKYHQFTPEPDVLSARILASDGATGGPGGEGSDPPLNPARVHTVPLELPTTLEALTALRDRAFVETAYRLFLGREPDPAGLASYVHQLRSGALDKVDLLGDLRDSPEGRQRGVEVAGLNWRYTLRRFGRRRGIGWLFRWVMAVLRLPTLVRVAQRHQANIEQASVVAEEHAAAIQQIGSELHEVRGHARTLATRLQTAESALGELFGAARALSTRLDGSDGKVAALGPQIGALQNHLAALERDLGVVRDDARALHAALAATEKSFETRHLRLSAANTRLIERMKELSGSLGPVASSRAGSAVTPGAPADLDDWYVAFEDHFRGSREDTKQSQELYLDYVATAGAGTAAAPILDIGCGRGEWLELLAAHGCVARGVDLNHAMVLDNRRRGLDVTERDVMAYLAEQADGSLGMVTGFHIIEHLPFELVVRLFDECRRVLKPGGCILFETPNPENLVVGAYTFYFDPTHRHPLPPPLTEFVARERGFTDVEILRLHPRPEAGSDDALLDKWFRGPADYSVIGWKDGKGSSPR